MSYSINNGSTRTLWRISVPLILSCLSMLGMVTIDRLFLARYSPSALSAAVSAGTTAWALTFGGQTLANVAGVFVAQHNGAKRFKQIGQPVWQMLWFSLAFVIPCGIAGLWFAPWAFNGSIIETEQIHYFRLMMGLSPLFCLVGALNGFFIGRGQTHVITWLALIGNLVNLVLDPILIFGWYGVSSYGMAGACIATGIGLLTQILIMLWMFLRKEHREEYGTGNWRPCWQVMRDCIRIGSPEAFAVTLELGAWGAFYCLLSELSAVHILVASVGQTLVMAFFCVGIGLEQGTSSVCGNLIGAKQEGEIRRLYYSGLRITLVYGVFLSLLFWLAGDMIIDAFVTHPESLEGAEHIGVIDASQLDTVKHILRQSLFAIAAYLILENIRSVIFGILRAAGDTVYLLCVSSITVWLFLILPTYVMMTRLQMPVASQFGIWVGFAFMSMLGCYLRFRGDAWRNKSILSESAA